MGDSSSMTIEFLRARLLSERSISRSARQRAEQLSKRVLELEEQLKIVTIQRKKAEKAASEVLAILEAQGCSDLSSEVIDSCSDQDSENDNINDDTAKEDDSSATSRMLTEVTPIPGKSLSWKGNTKNLGSVEKKKIFQARQRHRNSNILHDAESSSKHHLGKSCRKLKRKDKGEFRGAPSNGNGDGSLQDINRTEDIQCVGRAADSCSDANLSAVDGASVTNRDDRGSFVACSPKGERRDTDINFYASGNDIDEQMELALEKQAKLIGQYQEEENAQRQWEEKFNQNNFPLSECYSQEILLGVDDGKNDLKKDATNIDSICHDEENSSKQYVIDAAKQRGEVSIKTSGDKGKLALTGFHASPIPTMTTICSSHAVNICANGSRCSCVKQEGGSQEFELRAQMMNSEKLQDSAGFDTTNASINPHLSLNNISTDRPQSEATEKGLIGVLDALRRAKLYLRQEFNRPPEQVAPFSLSTTNSQMAAVNNGGDLGIPIVSAALFRLPTDNLAMSALPKPNYRNASLRLPGPVYTSTTVSDMANRKHYQMPSMESGCSNPPGRGFDSGINLGIGNLPANFSRYPPEQFGSSTAVSFGGHRRTFVGSNTGHLASDQNTVYSTDNEKTSILWSLHR